MSKRNWQSIAASLIPLYKKKRSNGREIEWRATNNKVKNLSDLD